MGIAAPHDKSDGMSKSEYTQSQFHENYPQGIENHFWHLARNHLIASTLSRSLPDPGRILEIGCGPGIVLRHLREIGFDCWGCELGAPPLPEPLRPFVFLEQDCFQLDPEFPNAWNDIGAYLIELGQPDNALFFLKRATRMKSHPSRCFPHYNLHRAYLALGDRARAIAEVQSALEADPEFSPAQDALMVLLFPGREERQSLPDGILAGTPVLAFPPRS